MASKEFVKHPFIKENVIERRPYQESIVETCLKGNTLCVIPTGMGKTSIAALVSAHRIDRHRDKKIMFLAPTKPLVEQHKKTFEKFMKIGLELAVVTGSNKPETRSLLYENADIIFATPQTIQNDLKKERISMKNFSLVIFDEAHRAVGNYAYAYIAKCYINACKEPLILGLTASPGGHKYKIKEVEEKLFIKNIEIRTREDKDVKPYIQPMEKQWIELKLPKPMKQILEYLEKIKKENIKKLMNFRIISTPMISKTKAIRLQQELARKKTWKNLVSMSLLAEILKIDHAMLLLETQSLSAFYDYVKRLSEQNTKAVQRLFKNENFLKAKSIAEKLIKDGKEHPKIAELKKIVKSELEKNKYTNIIIFAQFRDTIRLIADELKDIPYAAPIEFIGQAKKYGKGLSQKEQVQILNEYKMGFYNILVASQVGEEGLDIEETETVIFYEPVPSAIRRIQRSGRTARTHKGKVIILVTKGTRDEAYYWAGHHKEKKMKKILLNLKNNKTLKSFKGD